MRAVRSREAINVFLQTDHLIASYRSLHVLPCCPLKALRRRPSVCNSEWSKVHGVATGLPPQNLKPAGLRSATLRARI